MKKSRRTYNGVHLNKKSNTQDVVEQSLTFYPGINIFWSYYNHHDHHRETVFQCEGVQRLLK